LRYFSLYIKHELKLIFIPIVKLWALDEEHPNEATPQ